jgi:dTDP-glucose pyrophosphorylase
MPSEPLAIVVPMAGGGRPFAEKGYPFPKSLIEIDGMPMIEVVVQNITPGEPHKFTFIIRRDDKAKYALGDVLKLLSPDCDILALDGETAGALCSVLLAIDKLDPEHELLIVNADQIVDASMDDFLVAARQGDWDGFIMTFPSTHPKWSFVRLDGKRVVGVAEKRPISRNATVGIYYFRTAKIFLDAAERQLLKGVGREKEFYVAPIYNELVLQGLKVGTYPITRDQMHSLGTPEDVEQFLAQRQQSSDARAQQ